MEEKAQEKVSAAVTKKIAHLARLDLTDAEVETYTKELGKILDFVAQLSEVNVQGVEPVVHGYPLDPHFREDKPIALTESDTKEILACAEQHLYEQFRVPQVLGGGE